MMIRLVRTRERTPRVWAAAIIGAVFMVVGCAPSGGTAKTEELNLPQLIEQTSDFQREIIRDGVVTSAEYESALLARRDCVIDAGGTPGDIYEKGNNELTFDFDVTAATETELEEIQRAADDCLADTFTEVGAVWAYQQLLSPTEYDMMRPLVIACLDETGLVDLSEQSTVEDVLRAINADGEVSDAEAACAEEFSGFFSTWTNSHEHGSDE